MTNPASISTPPAIIPIPAAAPASPTPGPIALSERSKTIDVIRGVAVLGILTMNIITFGLHDSAYMNPLYAGEFASTLSGRLDAAAYFLQSLVCDQRFMTIFAVLFGAAITIATSRAHMSQHAGVQRLSPATVHYRRAALLIVLGLAHAYLLWYGDVLFMYGLCALWLYPARKLRPRTLFIIAGVLMFVPMVFMIGSGGMMAAWHHFSIAPIEQLVSQGTALTPDQSLALSQWTEATASWTPSPEALQTSIEQTRGSYSQMLARNTPLAIMMQFIMLPIFAVWRITALMMIGMALFQLGVLQGDRSRTTYLKMTILGYVLGMPLAIIAVVDGFATKMFMPRVFLVSWPLQYVASLAVACGHIGFTALIVQAVGAHGGKVSRFATDCLARVGRMSLTNYIMQTLLMLALFSGLGFALYEKVARWQLLAIVPAVWILQIVISYMWLSRYRSGPLEALTRKIVYA